MEILFKLQLDDFEIALEENCPFCDGYGHITKRTEGDYMQWPKKVDVTCPYCKGEKIVLTECGKTILEFVKKYRG